jgi:hypothetical protein
MRTRDPKLQEAIRRRAREGDVYSRLVVAEHEGRGMRLTADDVAILVLKDDAIATAAESWAEELLDSEADDVA